MKKRNYIIILVLLMVIGFASVATVLTLNGGVFVGFNNQDFDVYFSSAKLNNEDKSDRFIIASGKKINFLTQELTKKDESMVLDYVVTNNSKNYDAIVEVECTYTESEYVTLDNTLNNVTIPAKEEKSGTLTVTLVKPVIEDKEIEVTCELKVTASEKNEQGTGHVTSNTTSPTNSISGVLKDKDGNPLKNAVVIIESNEVIITTTDDNGYFYIANLEGNTYEIKVIEEDKLNAAIENLTKEEIDEKSNIKGRITSETDEIILSNNYRIINIVFTNTNVNQENLINEEIEHTATYLGVERIVDTEVRMLANIKNLSGTLVDEKGNKVGNTTIVFIDNEKNKYVVTTNKEGNFTTENKNGEYLDIYIMESNRLKDIVEILDQEEINELATIKGEITPVVENIKLPNNKVIENLKAVENKVSGTLKDNKGNTLKESTIVIYDNNNNQYIITTDNEGYFEVSNIEGTNFEIYILDSNIEEIENKSKEEIREVSSSSTKVNTELKIELSGGYQVDGVTVEEPVIREYEVTFSSDEEIIEKRTVIPNKPYGTLPSVTKVGYTFDGWYINETKISESSLVSIKENTTLTAKWRANTYTVDFDANGGNTVTTVLTVTYDSKYGDLPTPTRTGYTLVGWYTEPSYENLITSSSQVTSASPHTLYAKWSLTKYTISLVANTGGNVSEDNIEVFYGSTNTFTVTPNSGYYLSDLTCTNGYTTNAEIGLTKAQNVKINNNNEDSISTCTASFTQSTNLVSYITNLAKTDTTNLAYDGTSDNNLRYIGTSPNNYIMFNGETWRIIGVMNNVVDSAGASASHVKIIKDTIGNYSWDNKASGTGSSNSGYGSNQWSDSRLKEMLNSGPYWNRTTGICPFGEKGATIACDFSSTGLTDDAKQQISTVKWNIGAATDPGQLTSKFYSEEVKTKWLGLVGLMSASDYGYAVGGSGRSTCLAKNLNTYSSETCRNNDWLFTASYQWTLTPKATSANDNVFSVRGDGYPQNTYTTSRDVVRPAVYLNTNIVKTIGSGTSTDPFVIS